MINIKILKTLKEDTKRKAFIERNKAEHILKKGNTLETKETHTYTSNILR